MDYGVGGVEEKGREESPVAAEGFTIVTESGSTRMEIVGESWASRRC